MKQLIEELKTGRVKIVETPEPGCGSREVLVRNQASVISPGTEKLMIEMGKKSLLGKAISRPDLVSMAYQKARREGFFSVFREALARLDEPLPLGYSSAGIVIEAGKDARGFKTGDFVACAGSGFASHAGIIAVPEDLCTLVSGGGGSGTGVSPEEAAFVMIGGIALQGIRCAQLTPGENVVVVGLGLIGLLTVQLARAYGSTVVGVDIDRGKVKLAKALGCDRSLVLGRDDVESAVLNATGGQGADAVLLTAATKDNGPILLAERLARRQGRIVLVGVSRIELTRKAFWDKELTFTVSKASGPYATYAGPQRDIPREVVRWSEKRNHEEFIRLLAESRV
ncbi:MAG TPA: zinc-binding alcohol dehydrogenase, partial [Bacteroidota bacterium]|nr:zinc-binding alcohol dehydrogenase [Bacteroidota bacterium]